MSQEITEDTSDGSPEEVEPQYDCGKSVSVVLLESPSIKCVFQSINPELVLV